MNQKKNKRANTGSHHNPFQHLFGFAPKNSKQADYIDAINEKDIIVAIGPAGTGKSAVPTIIALQKLIKGEVSKIIFSRPTVELHADESKGLGYLPGKIRDKMQPYLRPVLQIMTKWVHEHHIHQLINENKIECVPLEYIRGNTFDDCIVILDEAQNASYNQIFSLLTRIGDGGKIILNGDVEQHDMRGEIGLEIWTDLLTNLPEAGIIQFTEEEIVRHKIISKVIQLDRSYKKGKKDNNVWDSSSRWSKCSQNGHCSTTPLDT